MQSNPPSSQQRPQSSTEGTGEKEGKEEADKAVVDTPIFRISPAGRRPPACYPCRARKTRCDGRKPVCTTCSLGGWEDRCMYQSNPGSPQQHPQSSVAVSSTGSDETKGTDESAGDLPTAAESIDTWQPRLSAIRMTQRACNPCRVRRIKCHESKPPCRACSIRGQQDKCVYPDRAKQLSAAQ